MVVSRGEELIKLTGFINDNVWFGDLFCHVSLMTNLSSLARVCTADLFIVIDLHVSGGKDLCLNGRFISLNRGDDQIRHVRPSRLCELVNHFLLLRVVLLSALHSIWKRWLQVLWLNVFLINALLYRFWLRFLVCHLLLVLDWFILFLFWHKWRGSEDDCSDKLLFQILWLDDLHIDRVLVFSQWRGELGRLLLGFKKILGWDYNSLLRHVNFRHLILTALKRFNN